MKCLSCGKNLILKVIAVSICLLVLLLPLSAGAEPTKPEPTKPTTPLMLTFGMFIDGFYVGLVKNDGTPLERLTQNGFSIDPCLSPDGRTLFFVDLGTSEFGNIYQILRLELQEQLISPVSDGVSDGTVMNEFPVCSPDGKELAFISRPVKPGKGENPSYRVFISDTYGKNRRPADPDGESPQMFPSWSSDGKKILYTHAKFLVSSRLMIRDLEKKTTTKLLPFYIFAYQGSWSPKGDLIAYVDIVPVLNKKSIWVVKPDGTDRRRITEGPDDREPSWYPDGDKLLFTRAEGKTKKGDARRMIYSIDLKTGKEKKVVSIEEGSLDCPRVVSYSPTSAPQQVSGTQAPAGTKKQ
jgi:Tol biopolymer transport system component